MIAIFVESNFSELNFIAMDYMDFYFSDIVHRLIKKEQCMVEMGKLKYDSKSKYHKNSYPKKEDNHVQATEEAHKPSGDVLRCNKEKEDLQLPLPPKVTYEDYL